MRLTKLEVGVEAMRDDIRQLAEGLAATNERLDRIETRLERLESKSEGFEVRFIYMDEHFDRFESLFRADRLDVQRRFKALEN